MTSKETSAASAAPQTDKKKVAVKPGYRRMTYELSEKALEKVKKIGKGLDFPNSDVVDVALLTLNVSDPNFRSMVSKIKAEREAQKGTMNSLRKEVMGMTEEELARLIALAKQGGQ